MPASFTGAPSGRAAADRRPSTARGIGLADRHRLAVLVPVGDQQQDGLADRRRHVGGGGAVAGDEGDLDAVGGAAGLGQASVATAHEARGRGGAVEQIGVGGTGCATDSSAA